MNSTLSKNTVNQSCKCGVGIVAAHIGSALSTGGPTVSTHEIYSTMAGMGIRTTEALYLEIEKCANQVGPLTRGGGDVVKVTFNSLKNTFGNFVNVEGWVDGFVTSIPTEWGAYEMVTLTGEVCNKCGSAPLYYDSEYGKRCIDLMSCGELD